jgi:hypothetical protein
VVEHADHAEGRLVQDDHVPDLAAVDAVDQALPHDELVGAGREVAALDHVELVLADLEGRRLHTAQRHVGEAAAERLEHTAR